jgi:hypothetical protein
MRLGDKATALLLFQTALQGANEIDIHCLHTECMDGIVGGWIGSDDISIVLIRHSYCSSRLGILIVLPD